jgi:hypothetical protein
VSLSDRHNNLAHLLSQERVGGGSLAALFRERFERQEQAESGASESASSQCTSPSGTCITIPPPPATDLDVCVQKERCRPRVALGPS